MGNLAIAPAAVAFPVVFCLTYFLCVDPAPCAGADAGGRHPADRHRDLARLGRLGRDLRRVLPRPSGRRARGLVPRDRVDHRRARRRGVRALARPRRAPRHEVSSNRRAARRLSRRASHQAPPSEQDERPGDDQREERATPHHGDDGERVVGRALERAGLSRRCDRRAAPRRRDRARSGRTPRAAASRGRRAARSRARSANPRGGSRASRAPRA